jgi:hypothetical protein
MMLLSKYLMFSNFTMQAYCWANVREQHLAHGRHVRREQYIHRTCYIPVRIPYMRYRRHNEIRAHVRQRVRSACEILDTSMGFDDLLLCAQQSCLGTLTGGLPPRTPRRGSVQSCVDCGLVWSGLRRARGQTWRGRIRPSRRRIHSPAGTVAGTLSNENSKGNTRSQPHTLAAQPTPLTH